MAVDQGVPAETDIQATVKVTLGVEVTLYWILAACNPKPARRALNAELDIGSLLRRHAARTLQRVKSEPDLVVADHG